MKTRRWSVRLAGFGLGLLMLGGAALAATGQQGSQSDPLVTLSYLNGPAREQVMQSVEDKLSAGQEQLRKDLQQVADGYLKEVRGLTGGPGLTAEYAVVELAAGERLTGSAGCEFLLRQGTAVCVSDSSPGLIDMTDGSEVYDGNALTANHLYLGSIDGRGVQAKSTAIVLVRGGYSVR